MGRKINMLGEILGHLTVIGESEVRSKKGEKRWVCLCYCGNLTEVSGNNLRSGKTKSCGCLRATQASKTGRSDIIGKVFGRLTVVSDSDKRSLRAIKWKCLCECGNYTYATHAHLRHGDVSSCGCYAAEVIVTVNLTHGMSNSRAYRVWAGIKSRCTNKNNSSYENYGGRGITYDPRWENFEEFLKDMGEPPENCEIERVNVNGNYCKENCIWTSDHSLQSFNQRVKKTNTSGFTGVVWHTRDCLWQASITIKRQKIYLGSFLKLEDAVKARQDAELKYFGRLKIQVEEILKNE